MSTLLCGLSYKDSFQLALIEPIVADFKRKIETGECSVNEIKAYEYSVRELEKLLDQGYKYLILDGQHRLKEIYDYFLEDAESDDISEAYQEFDGDYSEDELRLMKIKFMSEMAN